ncbi:MAG: peptidoglycan DD-metalloendopeptidase family protein [Sphingobacteriaceae bacterium]|nr:peptidoglycan DD-metalloendopeptidase family protein [Sphingobacteriaceae bacterium]
MKVDLKAFNFPIDSIKYISKTKLVKLIDLIFDSDDISSKEIDKLNYYSSLLQNTKADSVRISEFNLFELSFYSPEDEKLLFPFTSTEEIPTSFNLVLENEYLSHYHPPFKGVVTSNYGWRDGKMHNGIDIDLNKGDKVCAAFDGKVRIAKRQGGFGNLVILMHPNGLETVYAHLSKIKVKTGDVVLSGQTIGLGGSTGHSTGSHLHFEVRYLSHPMNPATFISFQAFKLCYHTITIKNSKHKLTAYPSNCSLHTVSKGESWSVIAQKYGISTRQLLAYNGVSKRYYLRPGQQLRVQ